MKVIFVEDGEIVYNEFINISLVYIFMVYIVVVIVLFVSDFYLIF